MKWRACCFCVFVRPSTVVDPLFLTDYLKPFLGLNPRFSSLFPCSLLFLTFSFFFWKHKRNAFHFVVIHLSLQNYDNKIENTIRVQLQIH